MTTTALIALLSHWRRKPGQLATLIIGLGLATALWTSVQAINAEARASYDEASATLGGGSVLVLTARDGRIPLSRWALLRRDGWAASPIIEGEYAIDGARFLLRGVEPLSGLGNGTAIPEDQAIGLAFLTAPGVLLAAPETAELLRAAPESARSSLPPVRVSAAVPRGEIITDIAVAARLLERGDTVDRILVDTRERTGRTPLTELVPALERNTGSANGEVAQLTGSFHLNLTAFGFLSFAVGLFIVYAAIGLAFEQRRATLRTLRALGTPVSSIIAALIIEALALALLAGAIGVILGYVVASALLPGVAATLRGLYGASVAGELAIRPQWWLSGFAIAVLGALAATALSIRRAATLPLLAAAQPRAWAMASARRFVQQAIAALVLLAVAALIPHFFSGIIAGFAMLAALLFGAALILPPALALALRLIQRLARGPIAEWFLADTRQQLPGLSLALMALMLALATNIGVGTMVSSFRLTFEGWLDQRLAAELYVTTRDETQSAQVHEWLEPRTEAVLPIWSAESEIAGRSGEVFGVVDHATYRDNWPLLIATDTAWDEVAAGNGILVNEQAWRSLGLALGDPVRLGTQPSMTLVGVYTDYGNPNAQAIIGLDALLTRYDSEVSRLRYGLRLPPGDTPALAQALRAEFDLPANGVIDQAQVKAFSMSVFERTFAVTAALNVLTLSVAAFAMFASLATLASMRLPQLAPVWALGLSRASLARLELIRAGVLALMTWLIALPTGLLLAWVLLAVVNVEAFGWRLPIHLFPLDWLILAVLAILAAFIAALLPARALIKRPPREFLQIFAQER
ncbi:ABC transporter permease [Maricaulis sp.]|uniref:ABC transporter permease n=1 Tax=Maricaulis sp. TaxID=1486257 RepID=UPI002616EC6C|nr:ABC transporter permease [Maricaulis sp.]